MAGIEKEIEARELGPIDFIASQTEQEREKALNRAQRKKQLDDDLKSLKPTYRQRMTSTDYANAIRNARDQQLAQLSNTIIQSRRGVGYKPNLAYKEGADEFITKNPDYMYVYGDFDNNIKTPDNIVVLDSRGNPHYIDGYYLRDDNERRGMAAAVAPIKSTRHYKTMDKLEKRLFTIFAKENWQNPTFINEPNFKDWLKYYMRTHPNVGTVSPMHVLQKTIADKIKDELDRLGLEPKDIRFIEMQSHILSNLIDQTKKEYGVAKLTTKQHWATVENGFNAIRDWPRLIQNYVLQGAGWNINLKNYYIDDAEARRKYNLGFNESARLKKYGGSDRTKPIRAWEPPSEGGSSSSSSSSAPPPAFHELAYRSPLRRVGPPPGFGGSEIPPTLLVSPEPESKE
jgi:hypothetical protein